jgi:hypothetical protein
MLSDVLERNLKATEFIPWGYQVIYNALSVDGARTECARTGNKPHLLLLNKKAHFLV